MVLERFVLIYDVSLSLTLMYNLYSVYFQAVAKYIRILTLSWLSAPKVVHARKISRKTTRYYRPQSSRVLNTCPTSSLFISQTPTAPSTTSSHSTSSPMPNVTSTSFCHTKPSAAIKRPPSSSLSHGASTRALPLDRDNAAWHVSTHNSHSA